MATTPLGNSSALNDVLTQLATTIDKRASADTEKSYTAKLLAKGNLHCGKKIAEEGAELALALAAQGKTETASETADLLYHIFVGLRSKGVTLSDVAVALAKRQGISGIDEKSGRKKD